MRNLILFFIKYSPLFLFVIYITIGCFMLFENNPYQKHVYLTSANTVSSSIYEVSNGITGYFNLKQINEELLEQNSKLELENIILREKLREYLDSLSFAGVIDDLISNDRYSYVIAHVINKSTMHPRNYLTLNKGSIDGITTDMGVLDQNGVVGIVDVVGPHSSRVISLLNDQFRLSCKVKGNEHVGSLVWNGKNPQEAVLEELPRHSVFQKGDTIVTSGYSIVFPEGIPVGTVIEGLRDHDENFYSLRVKLIADFETLSSVRILKDAYKDEIMGIEQDYSKK